jgi:CelD/BcsL family acetyltransferase involved in cellulose biosynthesis
VTDLDATTVGLESALELLGEFERARPHPEFAGSSAWCRATADVRGEEALVPIVMSKAGGDPVGVLLLQRVAAGWRSGSPGQSCLRWPFQEFGYHFTPAWRSADDADPRWIDALVIAHPSDHVELLRCAPTARVEPTHSRMRVVDGPTTWRLSVDGDFERWRGGLRGEHRRDLGYYSRRIAKAGGAWDDLNPDDDPAAALGDCFDLHARRVAAKGQSSAYLEPAARRFLVRLTELHRSSTRVTRLTIDGQVVAANLSFVHNGHYQCFMPGWEPRFHKLDLGRQVIYHQIEREFAAAAGLASIDLLGGDLAYKREFGLTPHPTLDIVSRPSTGASVREELAQSAIRVYRRLARS